MTNDIEGNVEVLPPTEKTLLVSYAMHNEFNKRVWNKDSKERKSFHNAEHINAVAIASDRLISNAEFGNDPLDIQADMERWNSQHPDSQIKDLKQFKMIARMAFAAHDWGNIMEDADFDENGIMTPHYHADGYRAENAELRSQQIYEKYIMANADIPDEEKQAYVNVGKEIIWQTVGFASEEEYNKPFGRFVRVVDQIGNDAFSTNENRVEGLVEENLQDPSKKDTQINPKAYLNFYHWRMRMLVKDEEKIKQIYDAWGKKEEEQIDFPVDRDLPVSEALKVMKLYRKIKEEGLNSQVIEEAKRAGYPELVEGGEMRGWDELTPENENSSENLKQQ